MRTSKRVAILNKALFWKTSAPSRRICSLLVLICPLNCILYVVIYFLYVLKSTSSIFKIVHKTVYFLPFDCFFFWAQLNFKLLLGCQLTCLLLETPKLTAVTLRNCSLLETPKLQKCFMLQHIFKLLMFCMLTAWNTWPSCSSALLLVTSLYRSCRDYFLNRVWPLQLWLLSIVVVYLHFYILISNTFCQQNNLSNVFLLLPGFNKLTINNVCSF